MNRSFVLVAALALIAGVSAWIFLAPERNTEDPPEQSPPPISQPPRSDDAAPDERADEEAASEAPPTRLAVDPVAELEVEADQIAFFGRVVGSEIPLDQLMVRLNILDLAPEELEAFDPQDPMTWTFGDGVRRSKARPLEVDGSFVLIGRPPLPDAAIPDGGRRYVVELCYEPALGDDDTAWPRLGSQSLVPVAFGWGELAALGTKHGPIELTPRAPHELELRVWDGDESAWMSEQFRLAMVAGGASGGMDLSVDRKALSAGDVRRILLSSTAGPVEVQLQLEAVVGEIFTGVDVGIEPQTLRVDGPTVYELAPPPLGYVFVQLEGPRTLPGEKRESWPFVEATITRQHEGEEAPTPVRSLLSRWIGEQLGPNDAASRRRAARLTDSGNLYVDAQANTWLVLGWLPIGTFGVEVYSEADGRRWRLDDIRVGAGLISTHLAPMVERQPKVTLRIAESAPTELLAKVSAYNADGGRLGFPARHAEGRGPVDVILWPETRFLAVQSDASPDRARFYTAEVPGGQAPDNQLTLRAGAHRHEVDLAARGLTKGRLHLSNRLGGATEWTSTFGGVRYSTEHGASFTFEGLPPGEYRVFIHDDVKRRSASHDEIHAQRIDFTVP